VTPELLRKVFAAQGISLSKVFLERGHYHIEGSRAQADAEQAARDRGMPKYTAAQLRDEVLQPSAQVRGTEDAAPLRRSGPGGRVRQDSPASRRRRPTCGDDRDLPAAAGPVEDHHQGGAAPDRRLGDELRAGSRRASRRRDRAHSKNLGDALVNTFKRAAAAMLESGILNLLSGGKQGVSFGSMITSLGGLFGGKTPAACTRRDGVRRACQRRHALPRQRKRR
jgi:hypothetical protein